MIVNYLKTSVRALLGNRLFSLINVLGLSIGLASTIVIGLFVFDELSYDRHYEDASQIYRVSRDFYQQNLYGAANAPQVAPLLVEDFPEIEYAARLFGGQALLSRDEVAFYESDLRFVDPAFFDIFSFGWLAGDPSQALASPFTIVLTESIARKYFGDADPLGQTVTLENAVEMEVTGVIADLPHNTHLKAQAIGALSTLPPMVGQGFLNDWGSNNFHTYVKLREGADIQELETRFPDFMSRHFRENAEEFTGISAMWIGNIHLHSTRENEMSPPGSINNVYIFSTSALFILLIACFNFMNLSTARSSQRGLEVGVRKSMGASRRQIALQFYGESVLMTFVAILLALMLVEVALPFFNNFVGKQLSLNLWRDWQLQTVLLGLALLVSLVAGSYPAFYLSSLKPVQVLKGSWSLGSRVSLRNVLVVIQFSTAIMLVVATLVVVQQMRYARSIELGFQKDQILVLTGSPTAGFGPQWQVIKQELLSHPEISHVTSSSQTPLENNTNSLGITVEGQKESGGIPFMRIDHDFFATYNIPVLAGREFSEDFPSDRLSRLTDPGEARDSSFVINRLAAERYGWTPEEALGKSASIFYGTGSATGTIIGVVDNSYFESVRSAIKPMLFYLPEYIEDNTASMDHASIRLAGNDLEASLRHVETVWQRFLPELPLARNFLDDDFEALYQKESQQGDMFYYFSLLAIFIACMGLFGLASFNAERRRKEVGVRKVMGGSVWSIVLLLTNDFSKLVLISNLIAWPVAYIAMNRWLENFAYRIDLTPLVFIGSGLIALCIAWATVGGTAAKAASQKPVLALRYE